MKKRTLGGMAILAFALCAISIALIAGTLARYSSQTTGTGTINVAQWSNFKFQDDVKSEATFTFDLKDTKTANENVVATQIAPGDKGSFTFTIGPAEVAYSYSAAISALANTAVPVKFYSDAAMTAAWSNSDPTAVNTTNAVLPITQTVYWKWDTASTDEDDTAVGLANGSTTFTITLTAQQKLAGD